MTRTHRPGPNNRLAQDFLFNLLFRIGMSPVLRRHRIQKRRLLGGGGFVDDLLTAMGGRVCSKCGPRPVEDFTARDVWCRGCRRDYNRAYRGTGKGKRASRAWKERNPEKVKEGHRRYRATGKHRAWESSPRGKLHAAIRRLRYDIEWEACSEGRRDRMKVRLRNLERDYRERYQTR
jgi:hypothetical protein